MSKYQKVNWKKKLDFWLFGWIVNWAYPEYYRPKYGYKSYRNIFIYNLIPQKIFGINRHVPWPVHFTSRVGNPEKIKTGIMSDPGDNIGIYIQANMGIEIGHNVGIGAGSALISSNHNHNDHSVHDEVRPIRIGNNVFIGANSVILPGIQIGNNVVIGAGSVVAKDIPSNSIAVGNPCKVIKEKQPYIERFDQIEFNRKIPEKYKDYFSSY
ncbi:acyltransferase [Moheibacter sp.]|uniref:acyltransferase n=1 Tax=Moheibacter sp. TaxID=1965316 RepID=UPI003C70A467